MIPKGDSSYARDGLGGRNHSINGAGALAPPGNSQIKQSLGPCVGFGIPVLRGRLLSTALAWFLFRRQCSHIRVILHRRSGNDHQHPITSEDLVRLLKAQLDENIDRRGSFSDDSVAIYDTSKFKRRTVRPATSKRCASVILDDCCPNVILHRRSGNDHQHPITSEDLVRLLKAQFSKRCASVNILVQLCF
jgi:hypothetical protein